MTAAGLLLALALSASAQSPMPTPPSDSAAQNAGPAPAPAVSTAAAVAASTEAAVAVSTGGVRVAGETKPKLTRPVHATIHPDAQDWEPVSLRAGGDPGAATTAAVLRQAKVRGKLKGAASKAKAFARLRKAKADRWLVISIFPSKLESRRLHLEVRFRLVEGFVEDAKVTAVSVVDRRYTGAGMDSDELRARGVEFEEESPERAQVLVSALDPRPSKTAFNAGTLKLAAFADKDVGLADASWSVKGLPAPK